MSQRSSSYPPPKSKGAPTTAPTNPPAPPPTPAEPIQTQRRANTCPTKGSSSQGKGPVELR
ncbi:hypothetical protein FRB90_009952, partial [Tulasnella sp. 427]